MRSCAIHVHKHSVEAMLLQQCREVTAVILSITPWLPTYMGQSLIRCNSSHFGKRGIEARRGRAEVDEVGERIVCTGVEGCAKVVEKDSQDC